MADESRGLAAYQGGEARRPGPHAIFEMVKRKTQLRALLEIETAKIAEALPALNAIEVGQLQALLADEVADCDRETEMLRRQVDREAALAASTKAMDVKLSREASRTLQCEMMRRIELQGFCPAPAQLAAEAVKRVYGGSTA